MKMKKYPHVIILGDENLLTPYPRQKGKVTLLALDPAAKVTRVSYWTPGEEKLNSILN
jgi:hypothetical protein